MSSRNYRKDIDGLRMIAVLAVVFNHAGLRLPGGFIGVDMFFVISGFLITGILVQDIEDGRFSILTFYERRSRRILPALFVVLAACLLAGWFLLSPQRYEDLGKSVLATLSFVSNLWFWRSAGDYFGPGVEYDPLLHTWSLAVEEQFYLVFPIVLLALASRSRSQWRTVISVLCIASLGLSIWMTGIAPEANFYLTPTRVWELGLGALLALGAFPRSAARLHMAAGWLGLALIGASLVLISGQTPFPGLAAVPPVLGAALILYAGAGHRGGVTALLSWQPFVWIGLISYSLYLWHWPVLVAARTLSGTVHLTLPVALMSVLISLGLATLSWRFVEQPFRKGRTAQILTRRRIFAFSTAGAVFLGSLAGFIVNRDGFIGQFSAERWALYQEATHRDPLDRSCMSPKDGLGCALGMPDVAPSIVIWGDSHAGAAVPGFDLWLRTQGLAGVAYTRSACPPLAGVYLADQSMEHGCDHHNDAVLADILAGPADRTVILFGRWALAAEGVRAAHEAGSPALLAERGTLMGGIADNPRVMEAGLQRLVAALRDKGLAVILIRGLPEIGRNVPDMVLRYGAEVPETLIPSYIEMAARQARANAILERVAADHNAGLLSPAERLCAERCRVELDGTPLYRDDDHLSAYGARWLIPDLMRDLGLLTEDGIFGSPD
jgi:peptidoglycan/LPS O-acetylase OafA/YrhL